MRLLTYRNCHRAIKVRKIDEPGKEYFFEFKGYVEKSSMFHIQYSHKLTDVATGEVILVGDYNEQLRAYEISEESDRPNLESLDELASRSHSWSSFDPESAGRTEIISYEKSLAAMLEKVPEDRKDECFNAFLAHVRTILTVESNIASPMVTGPAGFNNRRNQKAHNAYDNALERFREWQERYLRRIAKEVEAAKPVEQREEEEWLRLKNDISESVKSIIDVDNGAPYYRSAFVNSIYGKVATMAQNGKRNIVAKAMDYIRECNAGMSKPVFTDRHKFWKLLDECDKAVGRREAKANMENRQAEVGGVVVVKNFAEDRLQLLFDGKPEYDVIQKLKSNGFRWSPRFKAWQRQLTPNSFYGAARVLGVSADEIKAI